MSRRTEIQVGAMVLVALVILLASVTWLKDLSIAQKQRVWMVRFEQAGGLAPSDEVQVNGMRKGDVKSVQLLNDGVLVRLLLPEEIRLTDECEVAIRNVGLMGEKVIGVRLSGSGRPYTERDTIPGRYEKGLSEVAATLGNTLGTIESLTRELEGIAGSLSQGGDLGATMGNFKSASAELQLAVKESRASLRGITGDLAASARTARTLTADREGELRQAFDNFSASAERLNRLSVRLDSLSLTFQSVGRKMDRGEGTLGKLVNDEQAYDETRAALAELRELIADIKKNPKKYLTVKIF